MLVLAMDTSTPAITAGVVELLLPHELMPPHESEQGAQQNVAAGHDPVVPDPGRLEPVRLDPVRVLAEDVQTDAFGHAEKLLPLITGVLTTAGRTLQQLDAVVVGLGPGPFTGLRVGIVTAASLGDALGISVHGVPSHDGMARATTGSGAESTALLVVTDARRREVYLSGYAPGGTRILGPTVLSPAAVDVRTILGAGAGAGAGTGTGTGAGAGTGTAAGSGTGRGTETDTDVRVLGPGVELVPSLAQQPRTEPGSLSRGLVLVAGRELVTGAVPGPLVPLYLRRPDVAEPSAPKSTLNAPIGGRS